MKIRKRIINFAIALFIGVCLLFVGYECADYYAFAEEVVMRHNAILLRNNCLCDAAFSSLVFTVFLHLTSSRMAIMPSQNAIARMSDIPIVRTK